MTAYIKSIERRGTLILLQAGEEVSLMQYRPASNAAFLDFNRTRNPSKADDISALVNAIGPNLQDLRSVLIVDNVAHLSDQLRIALSEIAMFVGAEIITIGRDDILAAFEFCGSGNFGVPLQKMASIIRHAREHYRLNGRELGIVRIPVEHAAFAMSEIGELTAKKV